MAERASTARTPTHVSVRPSVTSTMRGYGLRKGFRVGWPGKPGKDGRWWIARKRRYQHAAQASLV